MTPTSRTRRRFVLDEAIPILARTPSAFDAMLRGLPEGCADEVGPWRASLRVISDRPG